MRGATFTTDGRSIAYTADEYIRIANNARAAGCMGLALLLLNLSDSAATRPGERYEVIVHPETARLVAQFGG
jgi:hypothetical protein